MKSLLAAIEALILKRLQGFERVGTFDDTQCKGKEAYKGPGNAKANEREPKSCLGRVFDFKLGCFSL